MTETITKNSKNLGETRDVVKKGSNAATPPHYEAKKPITKKAATRALADDARAG